MAKIVKIPDTDNVLRYAKKKHLIWQLDSSDNQEKIIGCFPDLFKLRDDPEFNKKNGGPEKALSVNWLEFFQCSAEKNIQKAVDDFCSARTIKKHDAFAKLNVGAFKMMCNRHSAKVRIIHDAKRSSVKSHSSITQLPQDNALLLDDLCEMAFKALMPAGRFIK